MSFMQPLICPELYELDSNQSKTEKFWQQIPFFGWWIAWSMWKARALPVENKIKEQLTARIKPDTSIWGDDPRRIELGQYLSEIAKEEMGWPNDHFIPEDGFEIVFWSHNDALDIDSALMNVEDYTKVKLHEDEVQDWVGKTLGEVVDYLLTKQRNQ